MIYRRGKKGIYWYRFRFAGRIVHESTRTKSKTLAKDAERQRRRELEQNFNGVRPRTLPPTFDGAARAWTDSRAGLRRPNTLRAEKIALNRVRPAFASQLLCDISVEDIQGYQQRRLREGAQGRTVNLEVGVLRQILKRHDEGHDYWQPIGRHIRMLPERHELGRALRLEEERRLLEQTANAADSACHTAVVLALNTAMRSDEIRSLTWQQIDLAERTLVVGRSKTNAGTGRLIPLNSMALDALVRWACRFPEAKAEHYVFPHCENRKIDPTRSQNSWRTTWRRVTRAIQCATCGQWQQPGDLCRNDQCRAGIKGLKSPLAGLRFHDLRHTAITKLAEGQASEQTIMAIAGHVSRKMLERYSHIRSEAKRAALERIATPDFGPGVHQNVHQISRHANDASRKPLN